MTPPDQLRAACRAALAMERAHDHTLNRDQALDRPARIRTARTQEGTTTLALDRPLRLVHGAEIVIRGASGARTATVKRADGDRLEVSGLHADAQEISGRPLHVSERLDSALVDAWSARGSLLAAAAGFRRPVITAKRPPDPGIADGLEDDQRHALEHSLGSELQLVLGPPGTGKTEALARTVSGLLLNGERVLLLAPTHAAVDNALSRIESTAQQWDVPAAAMLRQGRHGPLWKGQQLCGKHRSSIDSQLLELERRATRLGRSSWDWTWGVVGALGMESRTASRLTRLESRAQDVLREDGARLDAISILREARLLKRAAAAAEAPPQLIGATLAEVLLRPPPGRWDAVVIDEAAMVNVPYTFWASSLATRRLLLWGDPRQLGPVCALRDAPSRALLGRSLFHHLGLDGAGSVDERRPVLRVQHRMAPEIRRLVSDTFYEGVLRDGAGVAARTGTVDVLESAGLAQARVVGSSRANDVHARMAATRVERLLNGGTESIAVLTPYRAQAACLRACIAARIPGYDQSRVLVGTVHAAQGSEFDAVIVDLVATRDDPGPFLNEHINPEATSLLCVAVSRARTSLTLLADSAALPRRGVALNVVTRARMARAA